MQKQVSPNRQIINPKSPGVNEKMWDSLSLVDYLARPDYYTITCLVQKSIRFEKYKKLALYDRTHYLGNYEVHSRTELDLNSITDKTTVMLFGKLKKDSMNELKNIYRKGMFSEKSKFYFVIFYKVGENKSHEIKHTTEKK